ncbi:hypothetical protein ABEY63_25485, partial [Priestia aryabhattai]|uniref:hypothetical protein n=1 Tax=Priestia aryabhattai TaxID=412384 RepID=UPI003D275E08
MTDLKNEIKGMIAAIKKDVETFIEENTNKHPFWTDDYLTQAPEGRGLYFVWEEETELVYVGESGAIKQRMRDIKQKKHPLAKHLKDTLFKPCLYKVSFYELELGRVEMEELLTSESEPSRSGRPIP